MLSGWAIIVLKIINSTVWATTLALYRAKAQLGEVYRIDATTLGELDALRTAGGEYKRQLIQTPYGSAWMYVYQRPVEGKTFIPTGNWLDRDQY
jgi:gamma-glutamylcyclotransferase (GGCT)/AIG2-like uncharacterized protein YtfP